MKVRRALLLGVLLGTAMGLQGPVRADVVDGNPVYTDHHRLTLSKYVSLINSKPNPCSSWYGPSCGVLSSTVTVTIVNPFEADTGYSARIALCNLKVTSPAVGGGAQDGLNDPIRGCDWGNMLGYRDFSTLTFDSSGNCCVEGTQFNLQLPSSNVLTEHAFP